MFGSLRRGTGVVLTVYLLAFVYLSNTKRFEVHLLRVLNCDMQQVDNQVPKHENKIGIYHEATGSE